MSSMIERIKNYKCTIKNILSFILYSILFWLLIGYIVLPICNTFIQAFQSEGAYSFDVFKEYISNSEKIDITQGKTNEEIDEIYNAMEIKQQEKEKNKETQIKYIDNSR